MAKSFKKNKKEEGVVNYGKIKRNMLVRDTGLDTRFTTKTVTEKKHKKDKYPIDYRDYLN